ncbi:MAG: tail fiber domain-containing protein [Saprospiraceae bacterium]|nr:tail fiber domain-containing protein [Saprospiraceae bacterium]
MSIRGDGQAFIQGNLTQNSDERLKTDIQMFTGALDKLKGIQACHYRWIDPQRNQNLQTGLLAQDVQQSLPQLVSANDEGYLSVNYPAMNAVLLTALKELKAQEDENEARLEAQSIKIEALREMIRLKKQAQKGADLLTSKSPRP